MISERQGTRPGGIRADNDQERTVASSTIARKLQAAEKHYLAGDVARASTLGLAYIHRTFVDVLISDRPPRVSDLTGHWFSGTSHGVPAVHAFETGAIANRNRTANVARRSVGLLLGQKAAQCGVFVVLLRL